MPQLQVRFKISSTASVGDGRQTGHVEVWLVENPGFALPGIQGDSEHRDRQPASSGYACDYSSRISFLAVSSQFVSTKIYEIEFTNSDALFDVFPWREGGRDLSYASASTRSFHHPWAFY